MLSTGNIEKKYSTLGLVGCTVNNKISVENEGAGGCLGGPTATFLSNEELYLKAEKELLALANQKGGNGVIYANFQYRICVEQVADAVGGVMKAFGSKSASATTAQQVIQLWCYGTAVKIGD